MSDLTMIAVSSLVSALVGSSGSYVFFRKSTKRKEESIADQEFEKSRTIDLDNTNKVIELYKNALADVQGIHANEKEMYDKTIKDYVERSIATQKLVEELKTQLNRSDKRIRELTVMASELSLEVEKLKKTANGSCEFSEFVENCPKRKK